MDNKIKYTIRALSISFVLIFPNLSFAQLLEKNFEYTYSLSKNDFTVAHVNRKLQVTLDKLTFTSHAYPVGFASLFISDTVTEQSIINTTENALRPQSYSYIKKADKIKKQFHINFDWGKNIAYDSRVTTPFKLTGNTFDALSFQLALAKTLKNSQTDLAFTIFDHKYLKHYQLEAQGEEQLQTDAGQFSTLKYSYYDDKKKRKVVIWCAKQLDYLPIQIKRVDNDGDYGTLKLISLKTKANKKSEQTDADF